ncbi:MAG: PKD domain-containing protein [Bacteriovoracia bacterium]
MKKIILLVLSLCVANFADAAFAAKGSVTNIKVKTLIAKMEKAKRDRTLKIKKLSDPLVRIFVSPSNTPAQGDHVSLYLIPNTGFTDSEVLLEGKFDGATVALEHPSQEMWIYDAGALTEIKSHTFLASMFIQDKAQAVQIRDAIVSLEADIVSLNAAIAAATDPTEIAQLTAQRDEKVSLKNQLVAALASLKSPVGEESISFNVVEQTTGTDFPRISDVTPHLVAAAGGTTITISGANFGSSPEVKLGGITTAVTSSGSTSITLNTPVFSTEGSKDVEIRFTSGGVVKNAIRKNAFFATNDTVIVPEPYIPPTAPIGIAEAVASPIALGEGAQVTAVNSHDVNDQPLAFEWRLISKPTGSALAINTDPVSTDVNYSFTPDVPGYYVMEMRIAETTTPFMTGNISLAVVEVSAPANRAPTGSAPSITAGINATRTSQITSADADFWQVRSFFVTKQSAYGTASVSSAGLVSFQAGENEGTDTLEVTIVDNGTPPLSTVVSIPVSVVANFPPVLGAAPFVNQKTPGAPFQVRLALALAVGGVTDPDGTIESMWWDFGDGTRERTFDTAAAFILHNYPATGTYNATFTATDNLGATTSANITVVITDTDMPTAKFRVSGLLGSFPRTVTFDASEASDSDGIVQYRWNFGDAFGETVTTDPVVTHAYNASGNYNVRLRTRDAYGAEGEAIILVQPGISGSMAPVNQFVVGPPREVLLGTPLSFNGSYAVNPNVGGTIINWNWRFSDFLNPDGQGIANGQFVNYTYPLARNYFVSMGVTSGVGFTPPQRAFMEVFNVNAGHAPRAIIRNGALSGVAPFTLNVNGLESYDYDGTIASYSWNWGDGSEETTTAVASHVYETPGTYGVNLAVVDNDGNLVFTFVTVNVSGAPPLAKKKLDLPYDGEREAKRQLLTNACWAPPGDGGACYELGNMYSEDGDDFTKTRLWQRACTLDFADACGAAGRGK